MVLIVSKVGCGMEANACGSMTDLRVSGSGVAEVYVSHVGSPWRKRVSLLRAKRALVIVRVETCDWNALRRMSVSII